VVLLGVEETPLEKATRHAMTGARIVAGQKLLIAELRANGRDTTSAEALLDRFIATQSIFEDDMRAAIKKSDMSKRDSAPIMLVSFEHTYASRSAKMERIARAMSAGWMTRARQATCNAT
jgi:hypothetical protein